MTIYLLTQTFLSSDGSREIFSGLQRYIRELTRLLARHGHESVVIQKSSVPFDRVTSPGVRVVGIPAQPRASSDPYFNYRAHQLIPSDAPVIYCLVELTYPYLRDKSIAVQHGVWWDGEFAGWKRFIIEKVNARALRRTRAIICVDTNYINWALGVLPDYAAVSAKCQYIPNFVDGELFKCDASAARSGDRALNVLFPRRCEPKRGASVFLESCIQLWSEGRDFRATFCGWGSMQSQITSSVAARGYADRVQVTDVSFDDMPTVYRNADVVVVPTIRHEGTSLSCIEALHMGKPVLATYVGGLPNLVVPGVNGDLVPPTVDGIASGMRRLLADNDLRIRYGESARTLAKQFTLDKWSDAVWSVISDSLLQN
jgi:glycosyltransferase involved in cell wall biosynthesis